MGIDAFASASVLYLSFLIRFEFLIPAEFFGLFFKWFPYFVISQICVFYFNGLYARIWRYTSLFDLYAILSSVFTSSLISFLIIFIFMGSSGYPRSVLVLYFILNSVLSVAIRLSVRVYFSHYHQDTLINIPNEQKVLLLIGAGKTGEKIARGEYNRFF